MENNQENIPPKTKKPNKFLKGLLRFLIVLAILTIIWVTFSLIGRVDAGAVIPDTTAIQITVSNPSRLIDSLLAHESLKDIGTVPELASFTPVINDLKENKLLKNPFIRMALSGKLEAALLSGDSENNSDSGTFVIAYDLKLLSPLLRLLPIASNFITVPGLNYVVAGKNSRFEYRDEDTTFYIGPYRNLLFITDSSKVFENRMSGRNQPLEFKNIKLSNFDAAIRLSHEYINTLFADMDPAIAAVINNMEFDSTVEAGITILPRKIDFHLSAPIRSDQTYLNSIINIRSQASNINEMLPGPTQYATILSAGTLEELFRASAVFIPDMNETLRLTSTASRLAVGLTIEDLLFSWTGNEYAVFGLEGRPHPIYAIQINDERKRQEVFDRAFRSIVLNEDIRLSLDGTRLPRIELPNFLQTLLRSWNINMPSPYYTVHRDFLLLSESADTLLATLRAMQRNDVLPRTEEWRNIAGRRNDTSAFSLYYSLDRSMPFFLRNNTGFSNYLSLYRQGLVRLSFDRGVLNLSFSLVPGQGHGVMLVGGYPLDIGGRPSNQVFGKNNRVFFASGSNAFSINTIDNSIKEFSGQGQGRLWVIPAEGVGSKDEVFAWVVSANGRVTLVDGDMEPQDRFPVLTGARISAEPVGFDGKVFLCEEETVIVVNENGEQKKWETFFSVPLISPPSFLKIPGRGRNPASTYATVYPKSFLGEIYLLDAEGRTLPNWPAPISIGNYIDEEYVETIGLGYGTPLVFAHNNQVLVAFVCQTGELLVFDEKANPVSPFPIFLNNMFFIQPVYDGNYLWLISADGTLFRVSLDGELLYQNIPDLRVREEGHISIFDIDNDKIPEIFITGEGNSLHGYTRNFRSLESFPLPVWGVPYFAEPQNASRKPEVFGMGMDRRLYRWQFR